MLKKIVCGLLWSSSLCAMENKPCINFITIQDFDVQRMRENLIAAPKNANCFVGSDTILKYTINCMMCAPKTRLESWKELFKELVTSPYIDVNKESGKHYKTAALLSFFAPITILGPDDYRLHYNIVMSRVDCVELLLAHPQLDISLTDHRGMTVLNYLDEYRKVNPEYYTTLLSLFYKLHNTNQKSWDMVFGRMLEK